MAVPQFRYPLDKTGENPNNFVGGEKHSLNPQSNLTNVRVLAPDYGPFFSESIRIVDLANGRELVKDTDYKITDLLQNASLSFGKAIGQFVVIINGYVSNEVSVSYQVLGGNYQNDSTAIQHVYETFLNDTRPVDWSNVSGKPLTYPPSLHIHLLEDIVGFGPVIVALEQVKEAILLGNTPVIQALIDWVKDRKVSWSSLVDIPANLSGDFVTLDRTISTTPESGLVGGGDLTTDRSLSLQRLFTESKSYGSADTSLVLTVDVFGRVNSVEAVENRVNWSNIQNVPSTAEGLGLTDVVRTSGDQSIAGQKNFADLIGKITSIVGSNAANIHNSGSSAIMSEESVRWLLAESFKGQISNSVNVVRLGDLVIQYGTTTNTSWTQWIPTGRNTEVSNVVKLAVPLRYLLNIGDLTGSGVYVTSVRSNGGYVLSTVPQGSVSTYFSHYSIVTYTSGGGSDEGWTTDTYLRFNTASFWAVIGLE